MNLLDKTITEVDQGGFVNQHGLSRKVRSSRMNHPYAFLTIFSVAHLRICEAQLRAPAARLHWCASVYVQLSFLPLPCLLCTDWNAKVTGSILTRQLKRRYVWCSLCTMVVSSHASRCKRSTTSFKLVTFATLECLHVTPGNVRILLPCLTATFLYWQRGY